MDISVPASRSEFLWCRAAVAFSVAFDNNLADLPATTHSSAMVSRTSMAIVTSFSSGCTSTSEASWLIYTRIIEAANMVYVVL